jgi:GT2 family glycosyltransferase
VGGPRASVVVPNWNGAQLLGPCLDALHRQTYMPLEVVVADGDSRDGSPDLVRRAYPRVRLVRLSRNRGFAGNVNAGLRAARGDVLLLLNNDAEPEPDWVAACVETLQRNPSAGSVASKMLYHDRRTINSAGDGLARNGRPLQRGCGESDGPEWDQPASVFGASGGAAAYRRTMLEEVGPLDEQFFAYLEDLDLAFRAQLRGWTCIYQPKARVYHRGGATGGGSLESYYNGRNLIRLLAKDLPSGLVQALLPGILRYQVWRAREALAAWRGPAARATLLGQAAGLIELPRHLADRAAVQRFRRVSDAYIYSILSPEST